MNENENVQRFYEELVLRLCPIYVKPHVLGGHEVIHVQGVERLGPKIFPYLPEVDPLEYRIAAWLHNLDRCSTLKDEIESSGGEIEFTKDLLKPSGLSKDAVARLVKVVMEHSKKTDDLENDPPLLTAIRIADKLDRFTPFNILAGPTHRPDLPHFDPDLPFDYRNDKPCHLKYFLWNVEWYGMLPYDWARDLVDKEFFGGFLTFIRQIGRDISERLGIPNEIEQELCIALGRHYDEWSHIR